MEWVTVVCLFLLQSVVLVREEVVLICAHFIKIRH